MAVRRSAVEALGGFDPAFGPGARFPSCDDWDIALRAVIGGFVVRETTSVSVTHYGFRTFCEGRRLAARDWYAIGAFCAKPLRAGHWSVLPMALDLIATRAAWPALADVLHVRRPRVTRLLAFVRGFAQGLGTAVRGDTLLFVVNDRR